MKMNYYVNPFDFFGLRPMVNVFYSVKDLSFITLLEVSDKTPETECEDSSDKVSGALNKQDSKQCSNGADYDLDALDETSEEEILDGTEIQEYMDSLPGYVIGKAYKILPHGFSRQWNKALLRNDVEMFNEYKRSFYHACNRVIMEEVTKLKSLMRNID